MIFLVFFGVVLLVVGEKGIFIVKGVDVLVEVMLVVINYVMCVLLVVVFVVMVKVIVVNGFEVLLIFGKFIGSFYFGFGVLWIVLLFVGFFVIGLWIV